MRSGTMRPVRPRRLSVADSCILLYGRLDVLKAGEIIDIKFSSGYERGKYFDSTQHPVYLELIPEAYQVTYLVTNGSDIWKETYRREETHSIIPTIEYFIAYLKESGLWEEYAKHWEAL